MAYTPHPTSRHPSSVVKRLEILLPITDQVLSRIEGSYKDPIFALAMKAVDEERKPA